MIIRRLRWRSPACADVLAETVDPDGRRVELTAFEEDRGWIATAFGGRKDP